ncbi:HDIG domain-containing protein [Acidobacteriia bacterium AH_259_A11_L15]|nr:HDIG domain-containing protein [Acidobacteriia bacterium AH_259_A11_L15]
MPNTMLSRDLAWNLLCEFTQSDSLRKHALAVEACVRAYARRLGGDEETWGLVGLLHDFDYERYPRAPDHPLEGSKILHQRGYPEEIIQAILSHADYMNVPRETPLQKALYACDELAGFVTAVALVRPNKSLAEVKVSSVKKKFRDKAFARTVNREDIYRGAAELGVDLDEHIAACLEAMRGIDPELGLAGKPPEGSAD